MRHAAAINDHSCLNEGYAILRKLHPTHNGTGQVKDPPSHGVVRGTSNHSQLESFLGGIVLAGPGLPPPIPIDNAVRQSPGALFTLSYRSSLVVRRPNVRVLMLAI